MTDFESSHCEKCGNYNHAAVRCIGFGVFTVLCLDCVRDWNMYICKEPAYRKRNELVDEKRFIYLLLRSRNRNVNPLRHKSEYLDLCKRISQHEIEIDRIAMNWLEDSKSQLAEY